RWWCRRLACLSLEGGRDACTTNGPPTRLGDALCLLVPIVARLGAARARGTVRRGGTGCALGRVAQACRTPDVDSTLFRSNLARSCLEGEIGWVLPPMDLNTDVVNSLGGPSFINGSGARQTAARMLPRLMVW